MSKNVALADGRNKTEIKWKSAWDITDRHSHQKSHGKKKRKRDLISQSFMDLIHVHNDHPQRNHNQVLFTYNCVLTTTHCIPSEKIR